MELAGVVLEQFRSVVSDNLLMGVVEHTVAGVRQVLGQLAVVGLLVVRMVQGVA